MTNADQKKAQAIHDKTMELLGTVGMRFLHPEAVGVLKKHGVKVDGNTAYFTEEEIMKCLALAPSEMKIFARDPQYDINLGDGSTQLGPVMGAVKILEPDGTYRPVVVEDVIKSDKIVEYNPRFRIGGGLMCTPSDIGSEHLMPFQIFSGMMLSSKIPPDVFGDYQTMETCYELLAAGFGCRKEDLANKPRILAGMNINSPLYVDKTMTETLFTNLKYRQPCYLTPAGMGGSTAPITPAGTIVQSNAEVLGTLALAQMYAPGAPVLYGSQSSNADMRSLSIATGSPEAALCFRYAGIMGEFYHLPVRAGGLLTDSKKWNVQTGYEAMMNYLACAQNHVSVVLHAAGCMESYMTLSFEKMISDFQIIDYADVYLRDIEINEETVPMEDFEECVPTGAFIMAESTLELYDTALLDPIISVRGQTPPDGLETRTAKYIEKALQSYKAPDLTPEQMDDMKRIILQRGIAESPVLKVENARKQP